ncbi:NAD(P)-dependent alcohol dehydrogenase [Algoriphagus sp. D3-2-R+10]|uniref:NAD(P)-dependent alcohol dehydrogenase n=1 Tax=Algoriphagus aurantiacus TaxID=3103948 RepID=UPI002B3AB562|nr:NAD(P)-dependent alcohol dehydrogenase [Algoriphagus sp. D3-2-R+10]MEB2777666.1 NAD(P)-dependent alcohol dehydrogenase [Algoriphagus sp. D3-2-R+10]
MKAAIRRSYGSPKIIKVESTERPVPKDDELLIRVHATTVNRTDCANLTGKPFIMHLMLGLLKPRKIIMGTDFAGQIVEVGKNINTFQVNQRVFGFTDMGLESQAEYMVLEPKNNVLTIPAQLDYKQAAASLEGAHYAYTFIHKVAIQSGQRVLINGATGAIGSALLQFVRTFDVHVTATCDTKNSSLIKSLGADKIYDYTREDFTQDDEKYDYIFDAVGKSTFGKCKLLLKKEGVYSSSELGPYSQNIFLALCTPFLGGKKVIFPIPYSLSETLPYVKSMLEKGLFHPVIDREYPLDTIADAYDYVLSGKKTGNVIINL